MSHGKVHTKQNHVRSGRSNSSRKSAQSSKKAVLAQPPQRASYDVVVIGGGAAGLASAIAAAQEVSLHHCSLRIVVLEQGRRVGASIMRSGNGRCNFSHQSLDCDRYYNASFVKQAYSALGDERVSPVLAWFDDLGLIYDELPGSDGMLFPVSRKANSVLDVLRRAIDEQGIEVCTGTEVVDLELAHQAFDVSEAASSSNFERAQRADRCSSQGNPRFSITMQYEDEQGVATRTISAQKVIVATGGLGEHFLARSLASVLPCVPRVSVLGPLATGAPSSIPWQRLNGIRMNARLAIPVRSFVETGEVLFRDYGISGIVVFNASRYAQPGDVLLLDMVPSMELPEVEQLLIQRIKRFVSRDALGMFDGFLLPAVAEAVLCAAECDYRVPLSAGSVAHVARTLKAFPLEVKGLAEPRSAQVQRGGFEITSFDPHTLEAQGIPGLHIVGEALDIDGPCGGYNLHWAWTSGILAGRHAARAIVDISSCDIQDCAEQPCVCLADKEDAS